MVKGMRATVPLDPKSRCPYLRAPVPPTLPQAPPAVGNAEWRLADTHPPACLQPQNTATRAQGAGHTTCAAPAWPAGGRPVPEWNHLSEMMGRQWFDFSHFGHQTQPLRSGCRSYHVHRTSVTLIKVAACLNVGVAQEASNFFLTVTCKFWASGPKWPPILIKRVSTCSKFKQLSAYTALMSFT